MLHNLMVHAHFLFEASVVLLGEILCSKKPLCNIFSQRGISTNPLITEALSLFPLHACQVLFVPSFLRGVCQFSH